MSVITIYSDHIQFMRPQHLLFWEDNKNARWVAQYIASWLHYDLKKKTIGGNFN